MSVVHRAFDQEQQLHCALKILHRHLRGEQFVAQFASEGDIAQQIQHRNVIRAFDHVSTGPHPFFAMELAEGGTLRDWIDAHGPMPPRLAIDAMVQVCKGVNAIHDAGVIHRDIKPSNVLINRRGTLKLTDFGIARFEGAVELAKRGEMLGTVGYTAPEQREDATSADARSDVFSLGATLWSLLTGRIPDPRVFLEDGPELAQGVPAAVLPILRRATRPRRSERFDSAKALGKALHEVRGQVPDDPPTTPPLPLRISPYEVDDGAAPEPGSATWTNPAKRELGPRAAALYAPENRNRTLAREALLSTHRDLAERGPTPLERARHPAVLAVAALGFMGLVACAGILGSARSGVIVRAAEAEDRLDAWARATAKEKRVIDELAEVGVDVRGLEVPKPTSELGVGAQADLLGAYLEEIERRLSRADGKTGNAGALERARQRILRLDEQRTSYRKAVVGWEAQCDTTLGRLGLLLGAPRPPDP